MCASRRPGSVAPAFAELQRGLDRELVERGAPAELIAAHGDDWRLVPVERRTARSAHRAWLAGVGGHDPLEVLGGRAPALAESRAVPLTRRGDAVQLGPCRVCGHAPRVRVGRLIGLAARGDVWL